jgi:ATP-dependent exoDNAse (exonuclease V) beta subunit
MKPLNTIPIEDFLNRARISIKSNQKNMVLDHKEVSDLYNSLAVVMTRLSGELEQILASQVTQPSSSDVKMDGGNF